MRAQTIVGIVVLACGASLHAQTRALVTTVLPAAGAPLTSAQDLVIDLDAPAIAAQFAGAIDGSYPNPGHPAVLSADGRFVVGPYMRLPITLPIEYPIAYRDLVTGATGSIAADAWWMAANPRRPQVFMGLTTGDVAALDAAGLRSQAACSGIIPSAVAVSRDGGELYVACSNSLRVLDSTTGAERRRFTLPSSPREMHVVAGNRLFTLDYAGPVVFAIMEMSVYDLATGARLAHAPTPVAGRGLSWAVPVPDGTQVVVGVSISAATDVATPHVIDGLTAADLGAWPVDQVTRVAFTSTGQRAVLLREVPSGSETALHAALLDVPSRTVLAAGALGMAAYRNMSNLLVIEPPLSPDTLTGTVAGGGVTLQWTMPATSREATDYVLEVGSTAAATDLLTLRLGSVARAFVASNVPRGTYFVRIRALNAVGTSGPSPTIPVVVP
jgi:hypothetical protein